MKRKSSKMAASTRCLSTESIVKLLQCSRNLPCFLQTVRTCSTCHILCTAYTHITNSSCQTPSGRGYGSCPWNRTPFRMEPSAITVLLRSTREMPLLTKCRPLAISSSLQCLPRALYVHRGFSSGCALRVAPNQRMENNTVVASGSGQRESTDDVNKTGSLISKKENSEEITKRTKTETENILTVPNLLTTMRMFSSPFLGYLVVNECFPMALGIFAFAGLTDLLDGYIARNFKNQMSVLGTALDPLADKLLISILTICLTAVSLIPVPLTALIVARDGLLVGACFYIRFTSLPPPKTFSRYFDVTIPSAQLYPTMISKVNTALQLSLVALTLAAPVFDYVDHPCLQALWYVTGATTLISGMVYLLAGRQSVKVLKRHNLSKN